MEISYQGEEVKTKNEEPHHFIFQKSFSSLSYLVPRPFWSR